MKTKHLSNRALRRQLASGERRLKHACSRDVTDHPTANIANRVQALQNEIASRPVVTPENRWTLKPDAVVDEMRKLWFGFGSRRGPIEPINHERVYPGDPK